MIVNGLAVSSPSCFSIFALGGHDTWTVAVYTRVFEWLLTMTMSFQVHKLSAEEGTRFSDKLGDVADYGH